MLMALKGNLEPLGFQYAHSFRYGAELGERLVWVHICVTLEALFVRDFSAQFFRKNFVNY